ncbi:hypothetical protein CR513_43995, partial [Mucuna pruriens]
MELKNVVKDKKFWMASFLIAWAAALQGHMMWLQRQDSFKHKFGISSAVGTPNAGFYLLGLTTLHKFFSI